MESISLPTKFEVKSTKEENEADIIIEPFWPGYGTTIGNTLRRVLLSSLLGAAVTAIKIKGATHEFSTLPNVKEDLVNIILNFKQLRVKMHEEGPVALTLKVSGKKQAKASEIELPSSVEIINKSLVLFTTTDDKANVEMTIWVRQGRGFETIEERQNQEPELGKIAIDSIFSPVINVALKSENVRVGARVDFDRLILTIKTTGAITPAEAVKEAAKILIEHFEFLLDKEKKGEKPTEKKETPMETAAIEEKPAEAPAEEPPKRKRGRPRKIKT